MLRANALRVILEQCRSKKPVEEIVHLAIRETSKVVLPGTSVYLLLLRPGGAELRCDFACDRSRALGATLHRRDGDRLVFRACDDGVARYVLDASGDRDAGETARERQPRKEQASQLLTLTDPGTTPEIMRWPWLCLPLARNAPRTRPEQSRSFFSLSRGGGQILPSPLLSLSLSRSCRVWDR